MENEKKIKQVAGLLDQVKSQLKLFLTILVALFAIYMLVPRLLGKKETDSSGTDEISLDDPDFSSVRISNDRNAFKMDNTYLVDRFFVIDADHFVVEVGGSYHRIQPRAFVKSDAVTPIREIIAKSRLINITPHDQTFDGDLSWICTITLHTDTTTFPLISFLSENQLLY